jgi:hypothetical protein
MAAGDVHFTEEPNMTKYPEIFAALAAPFQPHEVKVRTESGRQMHYITARTAMNRLDTVLGPECWSNETVPLCDGTNSYLCKLTITLPGGESVTKSAIGGGGKPEGVGGKPKAGDSDAFKRAAVLFGVARYLYRDGVPNFDGEAIPGRQEPRSQGQRRDRSEDRPTDRRSINEEFTPATAKEAPETWQLYIGGRLRGMHDGWMREMVAADIETERRQANKEVCKEPEIVVYLCTRLVELGRVTDKSVRDPMRARTIVLQAFAKSPASIKRAVDKYLGEKLDEARARLGMPSSGEGEGREPEGVPAGTEEHWPAGRE